MKSLLMLLVLLFPITDLEINFGSKSTSQDWYILNDTVMGGMSQGQLSSTKNSIKFQGAVSLENNGGFASIRSKFEMVDLSAYKTAIIRYRSKGFDFALTMETDQRWWMPYYKINIPDSNNKWKTISISLTALQAYKIGRKLDYNLSKNTLKEIIRMGMTSNEKKAGPFELEIDYIKFE